MAHETVPQSDSPAIDLVEANPGEEQGPAADSASGPPPRVYRWLLWMGGVIVALGIAAVFLFVPLHPGAAWHAFGSAAGGSKHGSHGNDAVALPVKTIRPKQKVLERTLVQPGTIKPWAQAELFAKASGYLKTIQRDATPQMATDLVTARLSASGSPAACAARLAVAAQLSLLQGPQKDIGSRARAGEVLMEIATPERLQDIAAKESLVQQRQAELDAAQTIATTLEASVRAAKVQEAAAMADVREAVAEHTFRTKDLARLEALARTRTIAQEVADAAQHQLEAALSAWDSKKEKVRLVQAEQEVVSSKLATARADIKVKEALVRVAQDELHQAHILADYSRIHAPFDGVITYRGVDEGDFVQNATSGQPRRLMTVTAMDRVKVVLQVPEKEAPWVQVGTEATVALDARGSWRVKGHVARIAHSLDPTTLTLPAEIDLENGDHRLLPGMYGQVTLTLQKIYNAQAIPATAVYSRSGSNYIIEVRDGVAHRVPVRLRYDDGKEVEVVKLLESKEVPLDGSEELVVSNKGEIADGQPVTTRALNAH